MRRPGDRKGGGSVGSQLPGVDIQIISLMSEVGEVIARGDNVMAGYFNDNRLRTKRFEKAGCILETWASSIKTAV